MATKSLKKLLKSEKKDDLVKLIMQLTGTKSSVKKRGPGRPRKPGRPKGSSKKRRGPGRPRKVGRPKTKKTVRRSSRRSVKKINLNKLLKLR